MNALEDARERMSGEQLTVEERLEELERRPPGHPDAEILRISRRANQTIFFRTLAVVSVVLLGVTGWFSASQYNKTKDAANDVRNQALENCQNSVKPGGVRFIIADQIQHQLDQSRSIDYHQFFPNVPPKQLHKVIQHQQQQQKAQIYQLKHPDCESVFPKP